MNQKNDLLTKLKKTEFRDADTQWNIRFGKCIHYRIRMKISNTYKIWTFDLKIFELKRSFLVFNQILSGKHISRIVFKNTQNKKNEKLYSKQKMRIFKSNGSFSDFSQNFLYTQNEERQNSHLNKDLLNTRNGNCQVK